MPSVEPGEVQILLIRDSGGVECAMVRMSELNVLQSFILLNEAISNDLDLRLMRDGLEIRMEDRALGVNGLSMAIRARSFRIEALGDLILGLGGKVVLVLEDENLVSEECFTDYVKVGIRGGYRFYGYSPTMRCFNYSRICV